MDKLERLLNLTLTLLETARPLTSAEIRRVVPGYPEGEAAFKRAFERDKDSLREMGIPLVRSAISHADPPADGYRIRPDDYYLRDPGFEPDELAALHLAASAVRLETAHGVEGLWKLGGVASGATHEPDAAAREVKAMAELPSDPNLGPLFGAVAGQATVRFRYHEADRQVDPYRLDFRRGRWYVTGFDHDRGEERNFRVDRIEDRVTAGPEGAFQRPTTALAGGPAQPWQFGEGEPVVAHVRVDGEQGPWLRQHLGESGDIAEQPDGSVIASIEVNNWPAFRSFVLTFLEHAEILDPPELRDDMVAWLTDLSAVAP